jgi:hypothetical protein
MDISLQADVEPEPMIAAAIPLAVLINWLLLLGLAWLVKQIIELGAYTACKKWKYKSGVPSIFNKYCEMKRW